MMALEPEWFNHPEEDSTSYKKFYKKFQITYMDMIVGTIPKNASHNQCQVPY